jgi:hypothetical protein
MSKVIIQTEAERRKVNSELFSLTYGSFVVQLLKDFGDVSEVNNQLEKIGYNIGIRLIDDFLAREPNFRCASFNETVEVIVKNAFPLYLGVQPSIRKPKPEDTECFIIIGENPLTDFVELPEIYANLCYSNVLCGVLRGALEMAWRSH